MDIQSVDINAELMAHIGQFEHRLAAEGYQIIPVAGDGNCFYRSISVNIFRHENAYENLRKLVVDFLLLKADYYAEFIPSTQSMLQYIEDQRNNGRFGTNIEIHAMSWLIDRPIRVLSDDPAVAPLVIRADPTSTTQTECLITHQFQSHFNAAKRLGAPIQNGIGKQAIARFNTSGDALVLVDHLLTSKPPLQPLHHQKPAGHSSTCGCLLCLSGGPTISTAGTQMIQDNERALTTRLRQAYTQALQNEETRRQMESMEEVVRQADLSQQTTLQSASNDDEAAELALAAETSLREMQEQERRAIEESQRAAQLLEEEEYQKALQESMQAYHYNTFSQQPTQAHQSGPQQLDLGFVSRLLQEENDINSAIAMSYQTNQYSSPKH
ncbi:hypothetical protein BLNAU_8779 [Blattamonas nauphoetae]|uniref:ubiquitinyl hydrolase 1 n=1 Tax=Blattamonas nauphoetae TaxID=2049346 RepID=A0ABQ9XXL0_9EUKA|nr:hypothetical protein BLNAU_8779 [Blattamonas nauphoetae]